MDRIKNISFQQLVDFVNQQKPDKKIDCTSINGKGVGCLLTQFCRKKFKNKIILAGYSSAIFLKNGFQTIVIVDDECSKFFRKVVSKNVKNYHQLKNLMK